MRENEELKQMWNHESYKYHMDNQLLLSRIDQLKADLEALQIDKQEADVKN